MTLNYDLFEYMTVTIGLMPQQALTGSPRGNSAALEEQTLKCSSQ